jgi:hypothetical protein
MIDMTREIEWLDIVGRTAALELSYVFDALDSLTDEVALIGAACAVNRDPYDNAEQAAWLAGLFTAADLDHQHSRISRQVALAMAEMQAETDAVLSEMARLVQADETLNAYASDQLARIVLAAADLAREARSTV